MKIDQLIVRYLYQNKKVSLQDIGTFTVSPDIIIPTENDKDTLLPPDAISFTWDPKAGQDDGLIGYIMEHTRKIRPLATSDLESFSMLNTQFLNIGKPLILEGVGTLQKTQTGEYAFTQAGSSHLIYEETPKLVTEKQKEEISFASPRREKNTGGGKTAMGIIIFLLLAGAAIAVYYFMQHRDKPADTEAQVTDTISDDMSANPDSVALKLKADSLAALPAVKDSNSFYVVIKEFNTLAAAQKSIDKLKSYGNNVVLKTVDSANYKIRIPFMKPLSDTLRVKDSVSKFFNTKAFVEMP